MLNQNISFKFEKGIGSKSNFVIENSVSEASVIFYTKNDDSGVRDSVTRLGDFWKFVVTNTFYKSSQIICVAFGLLKNITLREKTVVGTFGGNFQKYWATFCSNIWSHWLGIVRLMDRLTLQKIPRLKFPTPRGFEIFRIKKINWMSMRNCYKMKKYTKIYYNIL